MMGLLKKYDTFIFDWDGTLNSLRTITRVNESLKRAFKRWEIDSAEEGAKMERKAKSFMRNEGWSIATVMLDVVFEISKPKLHNDAALVLDRLKRGRKRMGIYSNRDSYRLKKELDHLNIGYYFNSVESARSYGALKPDPKGLKALVRHLGAKKARTIYIGDMVEDVVAAKLAGIGSCAIADGFDSYHRLKSMHPDYIFESIEALNKAL